MLVQYGTVQYRCAVLVFIEIYLLIFITLELEGRFQVQVQQLSSYRRGALSKAPFTVHFGDGLQWCSGVLDVNNSPICDLTAVCVHVFGVSVTNDF